MIKHIQNVLFRADAHLWPSMVAWQDTPSEGVTSEKAKTVVQGLKEIKEDLKGDIKSETAAAIDTLATEVEAMQAGSKVDEATVGKIKELAATIDSEITREKDTTTVNAIAAARNIDAKWAAVDAAIDSGDKLANYTKGKEYQVRTRSQRGRVNLRFSHAPDEVQAVIPNGAKVTLEKDQRFGVATQPRHAYAYVSYEHPEKGKIYGLIATQYLPDDNGKTATAKESVRSTPSAAAAKEAEKKAESAVKTAQDKVTKLEGELAAIDKDADPDAYEAKTKEVEAAKAQLAKAQEAKEKAKAAPAAGAERGREVAFEGLKEEEKELEAYADLQDLAAKLDPSITVLKSRRKITEAGKVSFGLDLKLANKATVNVYTEEGDDGHWYTQEIGADGKRIESSPYAYDFVSAKTAARFLKNAGRFATNETWEEEKKKEEVPTGLSLMNELSAKVLQYAPKAKILAEKGSADTNVYYNLAFEVKGRLFVATIVSTDAKDTDNKYSFYLEEMAAKDDAKITDAKGNVDFSKLTGTGQLRPIQSDIATTLEMVDGKFTVGGDDPFGKLFESILLKGNFSAVPEGMKVAEREKEEYTKLAEFDTMLAANRGLDSLRYVKVGEKPTLQFSKAGRTFKLEFVSADKGVVLTEIDTRGRAVDKGMTEEKVDPYDVQTMALMLRKDIKDEGLQPGDCDYDNFEDIYRTIPQDYLSKLKSVTDLKVIAASGEAPNQDKRYYTITFKIGAQEWSIFADNATAGTFYYEKKVGGKWESPKSDGILSPRSGEASAINSLADVKWAETFGAEAATAAAPAAAAEAATEVTIEDAVKAKIKAERDSIVAPTLNPSFTTVDEVKLDAAGNTFITFTYDKDKAKGQVAKITVEKDPFGLGGAPAPDEAKLHTAILEVLLEEK